MSLRNRWILLFAWFSLPFVVLGLAGAWWFWERGWTLYYAIGVAAIGGLGWPVLRTLQARSGPRLRNSAPVEPDPDWTRRGKEAFDEISVLAANTKVSEIPVEQPEAWWKLLKEVLEIAARRFHPESKDPVLETPVPHVLRVIELVAADLREACSTHIPGAHILTLNDAFRMRRWASWYPTVSRFYRVAQFAMNPVAAVFKELAGYVQGQAMQASLQETQQWALEFAIKRAGFYAIELYSGRLDLYELDHSATTSASQADLKQAQQSAATLQAEPLRIAVVGQAKAGKSSLINTLFGEATAAVDTIPCTAGVIPYLLQRDGLPAAIIFDTCGYGTGNTADKKSSAELCQLLLSADLVLWVCSATTAAREADKQLLEDLRVAANLRIDRDPPVLIGVVTHIDLLRPFREWEPPYDLVNPVRPKAQAIRAAMEAIARELGLAPERMVPVCLREGAEYNVSETLMPAVLEALPEAGRSRLARCLRDQRDARYWSQLWSQSRNAGRLLWQASGHLAGVSGQQVRNWWQDWSRRQ